MAQTTRRKTWKEWFNSDEASRVKGELSQYKSFKLPTVGKETKEECIRLLTHCDKCEPGCMTSEAELQQQLRSMTISDLRSYIASEQQSLGDLRSELGERRKTGWRRTTTAVQSFSLTFDRFLCAYSGVVDLVCYADSSYGNVATATLGVLFATVKNKAAGEIAIESTMGEVADRLPEMDIYQSVYADVRLGKLLSQAYIKVIEFSRTCIEYYERRGVDRVLRSIGNPREFEIKEEELRECFKSVRSTTDALLAERVADLEKMNKKLLKKVEELVKEAEDSAERKDQEILLKITTALALESPVSKEEHSQNLDQYQRDLSVQLSQNPDVSRLTLPHLQQTPEYTTWAETDSSMLILYGRNHHETRTSESWLSEAALQLIQSLSNTSPSSSSSSQPATPSPVTAYYLCQWRHRHLDVLSNLVLQLLQSNPKILRRPSAYQEIQSSINKISPSYFYHLPSTSSPLPSPFISATYSSSYQSGSFSSSSSSPDSNLSSFSYNSSSNLTPQSSPVLARTISNTSAAGGCSSPSPSIPARKSERNRLREDFAARGAALRRVVGRIGSESDVEEVYLVIDRPEVCEEGLNKFGLKLFLETLVGAVREVCGNDAGETQGGGGGGTRSKGGGLFGRLGLNGGGGNGSGEREDGGDGGGGDKMRAIKLRVLIVVKDNFWDVRNFLEGLDGLSGEFGDSKVSVALQKEGQLVLYQRDQQVLR